MIVEQLGARSGATPEGDSRCSAATATVAPRRLEHFPAGLAAVPAPAARLPPRRRAPSREHGRGYRRLSRPGAGSGSRVVRRALLGRCDRRGAQARASSRACCSRRRRSRPGGVPRRRSTPTASRRTTCSGSRPALAWAGARAAQWTIEHSAGGAERKREEFRAYPTSTAQLRGLRRSDLGLAALRGGARARRAIRKRTCARLRPRATRRTRATAESGCRSIAAIASNRSGARAQAGAGRADTVIWNAAAAAFCQIYDARTMTDILRIGLSALLAQQRALVGRVEQHREREHAGVQPPARRAQRGAARSASATTMSARASDRASRGESPTT